MVQDLKRPGAFIIFNSHAGEALLLSDRITVLRDGKHVSTDLASNYDRSRIAQAMVARDLSMTLYGRSKDVDPLMHACLLCRI